MRFWVVTALRYIKSEEITPVELMTANELGSQLTPSARSSQPWLFSIAVFCSTLTRHGAEVSGVVVRTRLPRHAPASPGLRISRSTVQRATRLCHLESLYVMCGNAVLISPEKHMVLY